MQQPSKSLDITPIPRDQDTAGVFGAQVSVPAAHEAIEPDEFADHPHITHARALIASLPDVHTSTNLQLLQADQVVHPTAHSTAFTAGLSPLASSGRPQANPAQIPAQSLQTSTKTPIAKIKKNRLKPVIAAVGSFVLLLALFKSQIIFSQISYLSSGTNKTGPATIPLAGSTSEVIAADSVLNIPKINVSAPVVFVPTTEEAQIQKALEGGVVHYGGTALPGQKGNAVIVGHSSNDWWEPGNYKFVFVLLDKLIVGDTFSVNHKSTKYIYQVTEVKVVEPTELSVLAPTEDPTITIITCTPPGTSWKRLVIKAKQISPEPKTAALAVNTSNTPSTNALPSSAPNFFEQIGQFFSGIFGGGANSGAPSASKLPKL